MIELLLVVVIAGMAAAIAAPRFAGSFQGAQLKAAGRTVAMMSRYARSSAVLHQKDVAVIFYADRNEIEMVSIGGAAAAADRERFLDARDERAVAMLVDGEEVAAPAGEEAAITSELVRELPDGVSMVDVEVGGDVIEIEENYVVNFYPNGMVDDFTLRLTDGDDRMARIHMDPISGKVTIVYGDGP